MTTPPGRCVSLLVISAFLCLVGSAVSAQEQRVQRGPDGAGIFALAIDPQTPSRLYASTHVGGVFRSTDGGNNWHRIWPGVQVFSLAIDPVTPTTLNAGTWQVHRSTDAGNTWVAVDLPAFPSNVTALVVDPLTPTRVYAGTRDDGVFVSMDSGGSWIAGWRTNMIARFRPWPSIR